MSNRVRYSRNDAGKLSTVIRDINCVTRSIHQNYGHQKSPKTNILAKGLTEKILCSFDTESNSVHKKRTEVDRENKTMNEVKSIKNVNIILS